MSDNGFAASAASSTATEGRPSAEALALERIGAAEIKLRYPNEWAAYQAWWRPITKVTDPSHISDLVWKAFRAGYMAADTRPSDTVRDELLEVRTRAIDECAQALRDKGFHKASAIVRSISKAESLSSQELGSRESNSSPQQSGTPLDAEALKLAVASAEYMVEAADISLRDKCVVRILAASAQRELAASSLASDGRPSVEAFEALKPCPFCGGKAIADDEYGVLTARCIECHTRQKQHFTRDRDKAVAAWNIRKLADALGDEQYMAGITAGWNVAQADDPNEAKRALVEGRRKHLRESQPAAPDGKAADTKASAELQGSEANPNPDQEGK